MNIQKGYWEYDSTPFTNNFGWYFYLPTGGYFYLSEMQYVGTHEQGGVVIGIEVKYPDYNPVILPPLPQGVDLTNALKGGEV